MAQSTSHQPKAGLKPFQILCLILCLGVGLLFLWHLISQFGRFRQSPQTKDDPLIKGKPLSDWLRDLQARDPKVRQAATAALATSRQPFPTVEPALIRALRDPDPLVRRGAVDALDRISAGGAGMRALVKILRDPDWRVRRQAASALGTQRRHAPVAVPALIKAVKDENPAVRRTAVHALGRHG